MICLCLSAFDDLDWSNWRSAPISPSGTPRLSGILSLNSHSSSVQQKIEDEKSMEVEEDLSLLKYVEEDEAPLEVPDGMEDIDDKYIKSCFVKAQELIPNDLLSPSLLFAISNSVDSYINECDDDYYINDENTVDFQKQKKSMIVGQYSNVVNTDFEKYVGRWQVMFSGGNSDKYFYDICSDGNVSLEPKSAFGWKGRAVITYNKLKNMYEILSRDNCKSVEFDHICMNSNQQLSVEHYNISSNNNTQLKIGIGIKC